MRVRHLTVNLHRPDLLVIFHTLDPSPDHARPWTRQGDQIPGLLVNPTAGRLGRRQEAVFDPGPQRHQL